MYRYHYYPYVSYQHRPENYVYPPIDTSIFQQSLFTYQTMFQHGMMLLNSFSSSTFTNQLMTAAQEGNRNEVNRLIDTIGVPAEIQTTFTPTGITFTIQNNANQTVACCRLTMFLKWGQ